MVATGEPAAVDGIVQTGTDVEDADDLVDLLHSNPAGLEGWRATVVRFKKVAASFKASLCPASAVDRLR